MVDITRLDIVQNKHNKGKSKGQVNTGGNTATNIYRDEDVFNEYIQPPADAEWSERAVGTHHLHADHPSIVAADDACTVWARFTR